MLLEAVFLGGGSLCARFFHSVKIREICGRMNKDPGETTGPLYFDLM
jgi:hypothetical protein